MSAVPKGSARMPVIKICGLSTSETLGAALAAGADWVGFVRFLRSPRHVALDRGAALSREARGRAARVVLLVDPTDRELDEAMDAFEPDLLQLHGRETPERVADVRRATGRPVVKALGVSDAPDLRAVDAYRAVADHLLLDARPPPGAALPGGNGVPFDWSLVASLDPALPLVLSGGLDPDNVGQAIAQTGLRAVDVSSGVESAPGVKDPERIRAFVGAARAAFAAREQTRRVA